MRPSNFVALIFVLFSGWSLFAQEDAKSGDPSVELQNSVYYPHRGQFLFSDLIAASLNYSEQSSNAAGGINSETLTTNYFTLGLSYGFTDSWRLNISEQYLIYRHNEITKDSNGALSSTESTGLSDPTLTLTRRLSNGENHAFFADVSLLVLPSFGPDRLASTNAQITQVGNNLAGEWTVGAALPMYWRVDQHELEFSPQITRHLGGESEGITAGGTSTSTAFWTESVTLADRVHFSDSFYLQPALAITFPYSINYTTQAGGMATAEYPFVATWEIGAGYLPRPTVLLNLNLEAYNYSSTYVQSTASASQTVFSRTLAEMQVRFIF